MKLFPTIHSIFENSRYRHINEELGEGSASQFKILSQETLQWKGGSVRHFYYFKNSAGIDYRTSIVVIPASGVLEKFIIAKYPKAFRWIEKITGRSKSVKIATLTFAAWDDDYQKFLDKKLTGTGEMLKIISTNIMLMKTLLNKDRRIKLVYISGAFKDTEDPNRVANVSQRARLNKIFANKSMPAGWALKDFGNLQIILSKSLLKKADDDLPS